MQPFARCHDMAKHAMALGTRPCQCACSLCMITDACRQWFFQGLWLSAPAPAEAVPHFLRYEADDVREAITATSKLRPDQVRHLFRDQGSAD